MSTQTYTTGDIIRTADQRIARIFHMNDVAGTVVCYVQFLSERNTFEDDGVVAASNIVERIGDDPYRVDDPHMARAIRLTQASKDRDAVQMEPEQLCKYATVRRLRDALAAEEN